MAYEHCSDISEGEVTGPSPSRRSSHVHRLEVLVKVPLAVVGNNTSDSSPLTIVFAKPCLNSSFAIMNTMHIDFDA